MARLLPLPPGLLLAALLALACTCGADKSMNTYGGWRTGRGTFYGTDAWSVTAGHAAQGPWQPGREGRGEAIDRAGRKVAPSRPRRASARRNAGRRSIHEGGCNYGHLSPGEPLGCEEASGATEPCGGATALCSPLPSRPLHLCALEERTARVQHPWFAP